MMQGGCNVNKESERELMAYGRVLMARVAGREPGNDPPWVREFLGWLRLHLPAGDAASAASAPLRSIFTLIELDDLKADPVYLRPVPLELGAAAGDDWRWMPVELAEAQASDRTALYRAFTAADDPEISFLRFFHLMRKYASGLPNDYGEPGVSLFEQWKMVTALVAISGSIAETPPGLGLVGGDIPGIQRTINTITSKGAAKAMRGRSAFIQLLGHALVERLLAELKLGPANVVYDAGGNFVLLTGWTAGLDGTQAAVARVANQVNEVLLAGAGEGPERFDGFHGDLAAALDAVEISPANLPIREAADVLRAGLAPLIGKDGRPVSRWQLAEKLVKDAVTAAKNRPFGDLALGSDEGWHKLFGPDPAETIDFCAVCRRQRGKTEKFRRLEEGSDDLVCPECWGFNELANELGHTGGSSPRLALSSERPAEPQAWQAALYAVSRRWYVFGGESKGDDVVLALDPDDFPAAGVDGLRLLAHTTPMNGNKIKTNEELAQASHGGLKRLGVLRMDVDNLGDLIVRGLPARTAMQTAELSQALERFFAGWLDRICGRVDRDEDLFYVLFAGGDDLFVVGPWTHMPVLAQAIRDDFAAYTGGHQAIHLSAGIAVVGEKAPLYAAAEESHDALAAAKKLDRDTLDEKNAITFLGQTVHWEQFVQATKLKGSIVMLAEDDGLGNSVILQLLHIARRHRRDRQRGPYAVKGKVPAQKTGVYFGPWMWRQAYLLARQQIGRAPDIAAKLKQLEEALLQGQIEYLGLAARWAQYLRREGA